MSAGQDSINDIGIDAPDNFAADPRSVNPTNKTNVSPLLSLPAELIHQILTYLPPESLADTSATCRLLYAHCNDHRLWQPFNQANVPAIIPNSPSPGFSWRELYTSLHPYWFLPRNKLWFADSQHTGKLLIARYSHRRRCIEAYSLVAERGHHTFEFWDWNQDVIIHTFSPKVQLDLNQPVLRLDTDSRQRGLGPGNRLQQEIVMDIHTNTGSEGLHSQFMLTRHLASSQIFPLTKVWPPQIIPSKHRCRNESQEFYRGIGHKPEHLSEVSESTFRVRKWMEFRSRGQGINMRVGEDVTTYATLPEEAYTPTREKPWRGIWCGDYSGHGCEFLVVLQPDNPAPLPESARRTIEGRSRSVSSDGSWESAHSTITEDTEAHSDTVDTNSDLEGETDAILFDITSSTSPNSRSSHLTDSPSEPETDAQGRIYSGRLEAVKLTGDPNIPRGEYTFIAPDIGKGGLVRIAEEEMFRGVRIVRSVGHIAARGFREDRYTPSQLIMISPDTLAQYWEAIVETTNEPFGHISFYKRVNIDQLLEGD